MKAPGTVDSVFISSQQMGEQRFINNYSAHQIHSLPNMSINAILKENSQNSNDYHKINTPPNPIQKDDAFFNFTDSSLDIYDLR